MYMDDFNDQSQYHPKSFDIITGKAAKANVDNVEDESNSDDKNLSVEKRFLKFERHQTRNIMNFTTDVGDSTLHTIPD